MSNKNLDRHSGKVQRDRSGTEWAVFRDCRRVSEVESVDNNEEVIEMAKAIQITSAVGWVAVFEHQRKVLACWALRQHGSVVGMVDAEGELEPADEVKCYGVFAGYEYEG